VCAIEKLSLVKKKTCPVKNKGTPHSKAKDFQSAKRSPPPKFSGLEQGEKPLKSHFKKKG